MLVHIGTSRRQLFVQRRLRIGLAKLTHRLESREKAPSTLEAGDKVGSRRLAVIYLFSNETADFPIHFIYDERQELADTEASERYWTHSVKR